MVGGPPRRVRNGLVKKSLVLGSLVLDSLAPTSRAAQTVSLSTAIPCRTPRPLLTGITVSYTHLTLPTKRIV